MAKFVAVFVFLFVVVAVVDADAECKATGGCSKSEIHESYSIIPDSDCTANGTTVTATCSTDETTTVSLTCNNGTWSVNLNETCAMTPMTAMCPDLVVENGNTIGGAAINSTAMVTCSDGYQLSEDSSETITCTMDGSWSSSPECESGTIRFVALYCVTFLAVTIAVLMSHQ